MDQPALRGQLERYHTESFGWALSCCSRDVVQAEEVLQIVYLKILDGKARFDGRSAFRTWLFSVIRKTAAQERRRAMFHRLRFVEHTGEEPATGDTTDAEAFDLQGMLQQALGDLPKRQKEVLQLVFYHDLTIAEAAAVLGISLGSSRTHYERGKDKLRRWLEEHHVFEEPENTGTFSSTEAGR